MAGRKGVDYGGEGNNGHRSHSTVGSGLGAFRSSPCQVAKSRCILVMGRRSGIVARAFIRHRGQPFAAPGVRDVKLTRRGFGSGTPRVRFDVRQRSARFGRSDDWGSGSAAAEWFGPAGFPGGIGLGIGMVGRYSLDECRGAITRSTGDLGAALSHAFLAKGARLPWALPKQAPTRLHFGCIAMAWLASAGARNVRSSRPTRQRSSLAA